MIYLGTVTGIDENGNRYCWSKRYDQCTGLEYWTDCLNEKGDDETDECDSDNPPPWCEDPTWDNDPDDDITNNDGDISDYCDGSDPNCEESGGGSSGDENITIVSEINILLGYILSQDQKDWLSNHNTEAVQIKNYLKKNRNCKNVAIEMIESLMLKIPVIINPDVSNIYNSDPLNFANLTADQKVAVVIYNLREIIKNDEINFFDIHEFFYNLPTVAVDVVAKVPVGGKLLDIRIIFGVYANLQINDYPNSGKQLGPLNGVIDNYIINGYWYTMKFRTYGAKYANGADALYLAIKEKSANNYDNSTYFNNYMGY